MKLNLTLFYFFFLITTGVFAQPWVQKGASFYGDSTQEFLGSVFDLDDDGNTLVIGSRKNSVFGTFQGRVQVFEWNGVTWVQKGQTLTGDNPGDQFGSSASISSDGNRIAVGAIGHDGNGINSGLVRVYNWNGSSWVQYGNDIYGVGAGYQAGRCNDIDHAGNRVLVTTAIGGNQGYSIGGARVYEYNGGTWNQIGQEVYGNGIGQPYGYGNVAKISGIGYTFVISSNEDPTGGNEAGLVRVYEQFGGSWVQKGADFIGNSGDHLGESVSIDYSGNTISMGAPLYGGSDIGRVRVYNWNSMNWSQKGSDLLGSVGAEQWLGIGSDLSGDGDDIVVGSAFYQGNMDGILIAFEWTGTDWAVKWNTLPGDLFSTSILGHAAEISIDGTVIGAGATGADLNGQLNCGMIRIYESCQPTSSIDTINSCNSYTWIDGSTYTTSNNTATHVLTNTNGCDSTVTLNLTIHNSTTGVDNITACDSYTWIDGNTYSSSNSSATHTLLNSNGCDSIVNLNLNILNSTSGIDQIVTCDSTYTWIDGNSYNASNNSATYTLTNASGCDSIVTLDLLVNYGTSGTDNVTACYEYTWIDGITYTTDNNNATVTLSTIYGCDSLVTLNLIINEVDTSILNLSPSLICNASNASYQWHSCDVNGNITPIFAANGQAYQAPSNGYYSVEITQFGCVDTTDCIYIGNVGINGVSNFENVTVSPNPSESGIFQIRGENIENLRVFLLTNDGREMNISKLLIIQNNLTSLDLSGYANGIYGLRLVSETKQTIRKIIISKN